MPADPGADAHPRRPRRPLLRAGPLPGDRTPDPGQPPAPPRRARPHHGHARPAPPSRADGVPVLSGLTPALCPSAPSLVHPWIVRWVGVHGRAAVRDGLRAQFVVPGLVAVD